MPYFFRRSIFSLASFFFVLLEGICAPLIDLNPETASRAHNSLDSTLQIFGVQIGHFQFGYFFNLSLCKSPHLVPVGLRRPLIKPSRFLEQIRCRWSFQDEAERTIRINSDLHRNDNTRL